MNLSTLNCVILCGGKSSRMKQDKSLLSVSENENLTQFLIDKFKDIFKEIFVSAKNDKFNNVFKLIKDDENYDFYASMLGLYSILKTFKNEFVFIICVDYPLIEKKHIEKMATFLDKNYKAIIAQSKQKKHFLCGFYHSSLANLCKENLDKNELKIENLLNNIPYKSVEFDDEKSFLNLNFYDDYLKFKGLL
ncbi:molybdenum cofactor guanylyltransferase [Campylobacter sp. LR291e]|uniref:molybdenum cofactor guanylyltransferase n=1 Tax=Campylobacter sp. LR291e TaxID=2593546 RepID=UPI001238A7B1|nr:molybdenum cofactor guanylyltransferase [Campylobacter sp. LR291e]KAA6229999.1 molybdenum cofactor guanylyltransferase [Campylobacter sp. LR291e]